MAKIGTGWSAILRDAWKKSLGRVYRTTNVLAIVPKGPDQLLLDGMSRQHGWVMTTANTLEVAADYLSKAERPIILYDRDMIPESWRETVKSWLNQSPRPYVMLISRHADMTLWDEFQRLGGSDMLRSPLVENQVDWAIQRGWRVWLGQQRAHARI